MLPQEVDRLAQRRTGMGRVELGPEQGQQRVGALVAVRPGEGQIGQQPDPLGLGQDLVEAVPRPPFQIDGSEDVEPNLGLQNLR